MVTMYCVRGYVGGFDESNLREVDREFICNEYDEAKEMFKVFSDSGDYSMVEIDKGNDLELNDTDKTDWEITDCLYFDEQGDCLDSQTSSENAESVASAKTGFSCFSSYSQYNTKSSENQRMYVVKGYEQEYVKGKDGRSRMLYVSDDVRMFRDEDDARAHFNSLNYKHIELWIATLSSGNSKTERLFYNELVVRKKNGRVSTYRSDSEPSTQETTLPDSQESVVSHCNDCRVEAKENCDVCGQNFHFGGEEEDGMPGSIYYDFKKMNL